MFVSCSASFELHASGDHVPEMLCSKAKIGMEPSTRV